MVTKLERNAAQPTSAPARAPAAPVKAALQTPSLLVPSARDVVVDAAAQRPTSLAPSGEHVRGSADPGALWSEPAPVGPQLDLEAFKKLAPPEQRAALAQLQAERRSLRTELDARVGQLDQRWNHARLATRTEALREFQEGPHGLDRAASAQLDTLVGRAEAAQRRINQLRAKAATLAPSPSAKRADAAERQALAKALRAARAEQSAAVKAATTTVDQQGLKVDRLATTEQVITPSAPAPSSSTSLLGLLGSWFHLGWLFNTFTAVSAVVERVVQNSAKHRADERAEHELEQVFKRLQAKRDEQKQQA